MRAFPIVLVGLLPACLSIPARPAATRDAATDGASDSGDAATTGSACVGGKTATLFDDFNAAATTNAPCGEMGYVSMGGNGTATRSGGVMRFDVSAGANGYAYCTWSPFPTRDLIVKLVQVPTASYLTASDVDVGPNNTSGQTFMQVVGGTPVDLKLVQDSTEVNRIDWSSSLVWWRYRVLGPQEVAADYSGDGLHWTNLGNATWAMGMTSNYQLVIGINVGDTSGGSFTVDEIYTCE